MNFRSTWLFGALLVISGCQAWNAAKAPVAVREAYFSPTIAIRHLHRDWNLFSATATEQVVFRNQGEVDAFLARVPLAVSNDKGERLATLPPIDFNKEMGVLVISDQYHVVSSLEITSIEEQADRLYVRSVHLVPGPDVGALQSFSRPSHYVAIARSDKPVVFAPIAQATERLMPEGVLPSNEPLQNKADTRPI